MLPRPTPPGKASLEIRQIVIQELVSIKKAVCIYLTTILHVSIMRTRTCDLLTSSSALLRATCSVVGRDETYVVAGGCCGQDILVIGAAVLDFDNYT